MNIERLQKLIEANEAVPNERFEMSAWALKGECGTVGCAVGNYVVANPSCGLVLEFAEDGSSCLVLPYGVAFVCGGLDLCADHFGIDYKDALFLFMATEYVNPSRLNVIARIREFIATHNNPDPRTVPKDRISLAGAVHPAGEI